MTITAEESSREKPIQDFLLGFFLAVLANGALVGVSFLWGFASSLEDGNFLAFLAFSVIGIAQVVTVGPLCAYWLYRKRIAALLGNLMVAGITILINGACFFSFFTPENFK